jgi:hypothetical protein
VEVGSPDLKIGTTRLVLKLSGKVPVEKLRLKIWARGEAIAVSTYLMRCKLMSSISTLFFGVKRL